MNNYEELFENSVAGVRKVKENHYELDLTILGIFDGFYESSWDARYAGIEDMELNLITDSIPSVNQIDFTYDWKQINKEVGQGYANWLENNMDGIKVSYNKIISPSEYNFDTDRLIVDVKTSLSEKDFYKQVLNVVDEFKLEFETQYWFGDEIDYNEILYNNVNKIEVEIDDEWYEVEYHDNNQKYVVKNKIIY